MQINYEGGMEKLVADLGNLRYDALQQFINELSLKLRRDSVADRTKGRPILSSHLDQAADKLLEACASLDIAWLLCAKHMGEATNGNGCSR